MSNRFFISCWRCKFFINTFNDIMTSLPLKAFCSFHQCCSNPIFLREFIHCKLSSQYTSFAYLTIIARPYSIPVAVPTVVSENEHLGLSSAQTRKFSPQVRLKSVDKLFTEIKYMCCFRLRIKSIQTSRWSESAFYYGKYIACRKTAIIRCKNRHTTDFTGWKISGIGYFVSYYVCCLIIG